MRREIEAKIALKAEKEAQKIARLRRKEAVQAVAAKAAEEVAAKLPESIAGFTALHLAAMNGDLPCIMAFGEHQQVFRGPPPVPPDCRREPRP